MKHSSSSYNFNGITVTNTWIRTGRFNGFKPITQVYGVVFNQLGKILICREGIDGMWQIPGGTPQGNESPELTLKRELKEEVDVLAKKIIPLGVQRVKMPGNPDKKIGDIFYQARCIVILDKLEDQTPDPDRGSIWQRKFVPASEIKEHIKWGLSGDTMFDDATALYKTS